MVVLVDVRRPAQLTPAEAGPGPAQRVLLVCQGQVVVDGIRAPCGRPQALRLDRGRLVELVARLGGRGELVLGVDV